MLTKCAAPSCNTLFRYLSRGRLYRLEQDPFCSVEEEDGAGSPEEYFWLCECCCLSFHLDLNGDGKVIAVPSTEQAHRYHREVATISRQAGKLLRSVNVSDRREHVHDPVEKSVAGGGRQQRSS